MRNNTLIMSAALSACLLFLSVSCGTLKKSSSYIPPLTEVTVREVMLDPESKLPVVLLQDLSGRITLPIWIGSNEAIAIATPLEQVSFRRPMTHDLLYTILIETHVSVLKVVVTELRDNTFYANLYLKTGGKTLTIDSRPSDAIAIAVRTEAPIYVATELLLTMGIKRGIEHL